MLCQSEDNGHRDTDHPKWILTKGSCDYSHDDVKEDSNYPQGCHCAISRIWSHFFSSTGHGQTLTLLSRPPPLISFHCPPPPPHSSLILCTITAHGHRTFPDLPRTSLWGTMHCGHPNCLIMILRPWRSSACGEDWIYLEVTGTPLPPKHSLVITGWPLGLPRLQHDDPGHCVFHKVTRSERNTIKLPTSTSGSAVDAVLNGAWNEQRERKKKLKKRCIKHELHLH